MNLFAFNKPQGLSSNVFLNRVKRITGIKKVGHAGTLDPLASGVLVVGIGRDATKLLWGDELNEKEYIATIKFGETSVTDDEEGEKTQYSVAVIPTEDEVVAVLKKFIGAIEQMPPAYSALKISGTPAYKLARAGKPVELKARMVTIDEIELIDYSWPLAHIRVACRSGVYIRSLVRDIGHALGCGAYMSDLVRTRVGRFKLEDSLTPEQFEMQWKQR